MQQLSLQKIQSWPLYGCFLNFSIKTEAMILKHHSVNVYLENQANIVQFAEFFSHFGLAALTEPERCDQLTLPSLCLSRILSPCAVYRTLESNFLMGCIW